MLLLIQILLVIPIEVILAQGKSRARGIVRITDFFVRMTQSSDQEALVIKVITLEVLENAGSLGQKNIRNNRG